jgi:hypothetical protein
MCTLAYTLGEELVPDTRRAKRIQRHSREDPSLSQPLSPLSLPPLPLYFPLPPAGKVILKRQV